MSANNREALLVVDPQLDFMPGGALPVHEGDIIVPVINRLVAFFMKRKAEIYFSRDWHPEDHCSFEKYGGIWTSHCVRETRGAQFHPDILIPESATIFDKATSASREAYSAFQETGLAEKLRENNIKNLYICGLATDVCVKSTVLDALSLGFEVFLVKNAVKAVNANPQDGINTLKEVELAGAVVLDSAKIIDNLQAAEKEE